MKKYRVFVQKTVQEAAFEPFVIGLECQLSIKEDKTGDQIDIIIDEEYEKLEEKVDDLIKNRLA